MNDNAVLYKRAGRSDSVGKSVETTEENEEIKELEKQGAISGGGGRVLGSSPRRSGGKLFFCRIHFMCCLHFGARSTTVLPQ